MPAWSPTAEGFRTIFRRPLLSLAEISWRWSFWAAAWCLALMALAEYFDSLPVSNRNLFLLRTGQPSLVSRALANIFGGSGLRLALLFLLLSALLVIAWIVISSLGRAATLAPLFESIRERARHIASAQAAPAPVVVEAAPSAAPAFRSLAALNSLRALVVAVGMVAFLGAILAAHLTSAGKHPHPALAFLLFLALLVLIAIAASSLNWFLSIAALFAGRKGSDAFAALSSAVSLCRDRPGAVSAVGIWFTLAHLTLFVIATSVVGFPLAFLGILPPAFVAVAVLLITALYFALVDSLHIGRLAGYAAILEAPPIPIIPVAQPIVSLPPFAPAPPSPEISTIDQSELILSDAPLPRATDTIDQSELILSDKPATIPEGNKSTDKS